MFQVSDTDFRQALRLLRSFSETEGKNLREEEQRRLAKLLLKKLERKKRSQL